MVAIDFKRILCKFNIKKSDYKKPLHVYLKETLYLTDSGMSLNYEPIPLMCTSGHDHRETIL